MAGSGLIQTCTEMAKFVSVLSGKFVSNTVHEKSPRSIALMTDKLRTPVMHFSFL